MLLCRKIRWITSSCTPNLYRFDPRPRRAAWNPRHVTAAPASAGLIIRLVRFASSNGLPRLFLKIGPDSGLPDRALCISSRCASAGITGTPAALLLVFGGDTRPFQIDRVT